MDSNKTSRVIQRVIDIIDCDCAPSKMSKGEYLDTLEGILDRVECLVDCVKDELEREVQ